MISFAHLHRLSVRTKFILSGTFLALSVGLLTMHISKVQDAKSIGLPAALALPAIEQRMAVLKEQSEVAELQASLNGSSGEEMLRMYVTPAQASLDRLLGTIDALAASLRSTGDLTSLSAVKVKTGTGFSLTTADGQVKNFTATPVSFEADVTEKGMKTIFLFEEISGLFTVGDALTPTEQDSLLRLTENENPAAVTALESFLSTDLLSYARDTKAVEGHLLQSFTTQEFAQSIRSVTQGSRLPAAAELLNGSFGRALLAQKLWPLRFLTAKGATITQNDNGTYRVAVMWDAISRGE